MSDDPDRTADRARMLATIRELFRLTATETGIGEAPADVIEALRRVPRHRFVPPHEQGLAYADMPLPIGMGQTISQPYIVALMTALLDVGAGARVLEVGTGCGYQAAVLAQLGAQVFSLEVVQPLAETAAERLAALGYGNVEVRRGDGFGGWPDQAPFDAIMVTAAAPQVPMTLVRQLRPGANLVIPVARGPGQVLSVLHRGADGGVRRRDVLPVAFVPMVHGWGGALPSADTLLVRDAVRNAAGLLETAKPFAPAPGAFLPPAQRHPSAADFGGPRPAVQVGGVDARLVNGIFGDPLLHARLVPFHLSRRYAHDPAALFDEIRRAFPQVMLPAG